MKRLIPYFVFVLVLSGCTSQPLVYQSYDGPIFGTSFHILYEFTENRNLDKEILDQMNIFNRSLSTYDNESIISRFNQNDPEVLADQYFSICFERAYEISQLTQGAFDMTVAPLVNVWGFGFTQKDSVYPELIDSLLQFTGYEKVSLSEGKLIKDDPRIMLDASAIAKGLGVDVVSDFLESKGVVNYLVEIGGELRCKGVNKKGVDWTVGIDKPIENLMERELQVVLNLTNSAMATSGNYRQFYVEDGVKYSHTIDPRSGYPVRHSLLSATVIASDCMTADAYATAFMVLGLEKTKQLVEEDPNLEAYLIYSDENDEIATWVSVGMQGKL